MGARDKSGLWAQCPRGSVNHDVYKRCYEYIAFVVPKGYGYQCKSPFTVRRARVTAARGRPQGCACTDVF